MALNFPNYSATHILYEESNGYSSIGYVKLGSDYPDLILPKDCRVCSSSNGVILFADVSKSQYCLYNPLIDVNPVKPLPFLPVKHDCRTSVATLAVSQSNFDVVVRLGKRGIRVTDNHEVYAFSSGANYWYRTDTSGVRGVYFLPDSEISCAGNIYSFGFDETVPRRNLFGDFFVLNQDIQNNTFRRIALPHGYHSTSDPDALQMGRVGNGIGMVMVNRAKHVVEIFTLSQEKQACSWEREYSLQVVLDPYGSMDVTEFGGGRIRCREMPRPVRFESFKIQAMLLVGRSLVMIEAAEDLTLGRCFHQSVLGQMLPRSLTSGLPHAASSRTFRYFID